MADDETQSLTGMSDKLTLRSQLEELTNIWYKEYPDKAQGGLLALSGFEYQFVLILLKIVDRWKNASAFERQNLNTAHNILTEVISDITELSKSITLTQAKRTLSKDTIPSALEEFWSIFNLASEYTPALLKHLRFVISGSFQDKGDASEIIKGWDKRRKKYDQDKVAEFKKYVHSEIVPDPKVKLKTELENLSRHEDTETTIGRWLGYLIQIGSGISSANVSAHIWQELRDDKSLEAFWATRGRLVSQSNYWLRTVKHTLGVNLSLPRTDTLSQLQTSVLAKRITLLIGSSGSGKSALCKLSMQTIFQNYTALFLNAKDIFDFTDALDSDSKTEIRRIDELIIAQAIEKPLIIIDDLGDANDQSFNSVLNLIQNALANEISTDVRFILVAHLDAESSICEKIAARLGTQIFSDNIVKLPQLPINELQSSNVLPGEVANLVQRADEFGPALNLKLLDWLIRGVQENEINTSSFKNDLDLLNWFWCYHVGNGSEISEECRALIKISQSLADEFTPDLSISDLPVASQILETLMRRDCLRVAEEQVAVTHRFIGDCARFRYLLGNRRKLEVGKLVTNLRNPLWSQPIRWFALYLAMESEDTETWQELFQEALAGEHLQLVDVLLDGAIKSRKPSSVLNVFVGEQLPFLIERLFSRLFAIATFPHPYLAASSQSMSAGTRLVAQERMAGIPKPYLWEPVWRWFLSQNIETVIEESGLIFKAAEAWLNWGIFAEQFPLRLEVAEFILDLAQKVLIPDPEPQEWVDIDPQEWVDIESDLIKLANLKNQQVNPDLQKHFVSSSELIDLTKVKHREPLPKKSTWKKRHYLGNFVTNTFACIVFALKIVPQRSIWLLRVLAGREITPATRLEPTETSSFLSRPGIGVLEPAHPKGPSGKVNHQFRKFMLKQSGLYLDAVTRVNPQLGAELLLALTIAPPSYRYELEYRSDVLDDDLGTEGSDAIDVCTFKFLPFLYLLQINEPLAIDVVETLCQIATNSSYQVLTTLNQRIDQSERNSEVSELLRLNETDTYELTLIIGDTKKKFQGERYALYWHRNSSPPKIVACFLMTLEGWFYSRPTREQLEHSISLVLSRSSTVAMLGVLVSLAKWDFSLVSGSLLPLISSLQLLVWLEFEQMDFGQNFGFDGIHARNALSQQEYQELLEFNQFSYRKYDLQKIILNLWINGVIPSKTQAKIMADWDNYQLAVIPDINRDRALRIRAWFGLSNWQEGRDNNENKIFHFIGTLPDDTKAEAESARWHLSNLQIVVTSRRILDGEMQKTPELHNEMVRLLTSEKQLNSLKERSDAKDVLDVLWAAIAIVLEPSLETIEQQLEMDFNHIIDIIVNTRILLDNRNRSQTYNLNAEAFISHVAPKLLNKIKSESSLRTSAFRCLIGVSDRNTSTFMRSWIKEYGLAHPLTQELINLAPRISRLITLTYTLSHYNLIQQNMNQDGTYIVPHPEEIAQAINHQKNPLLEDAWSILQKDFVENKLTEESLIKISEWIPEILVQPLQECPGWLQQQCFDWEFLAAALIPVLEAQLDCENSHNLVLLLRKQVLFALLNERQKIYNHYVSKKEHTNSNVNTRLYEAQSNLLDTIVRLPKVGSVTSIDEILNVLKTVGLVDYILLGHVVETISYCIGEESSSHEPDNSFRKYTAFTVGEYLFGLKNQQEPDLQILGNIRDVWEKLIGLLSQRFQENPKNLTNADQRLMEFFERFQEVLLFDWGLKKELYRIAKSKIYRQFRRVLFKALIQHQELLPNSRNDESELLVQVIAELWDSDKNWIIDKQSRRDGLRTSLGQLQEIDAVGARRLSDEIADFLIHHPN
ncbi:ATP-binding protein [Nodularia spumigena]|uniref:ATP-binding protein n=1 Tax=Nodularia spumigena UHCC 0060 TaxID=3110300 RepID=A0ABU5UU26_NODSP|nr:ATP-binding protein [Nodularia spumigena]MEA5527375.1 ATP-binding protein [Nodularia spumigena UHCC 0143]MEA5609779.1 ATP-binding protein [Nodularia spumigena UHCC 0060]MEA5615884.1 ATP-binding protein [Nodularia spumigena UHCC 0040]